MRTGLVLGAGGTLGEAYHRGVLRALSERGLDARAADVVVGTSAGSIVAASVRRQVGHGPPQPLRQVARSRRFLPARTTALGLVRRPRQALNAALLAPELGRGRTPTEFLTSALRRSHGEGWPDAPLWIVAVRRDTGERVVFGRQDAPPADVASAVAASCAIPGYFEPVQIGGAAYVDGGVHSPTNADLLADVDLDLVVVSSPMSAELGALRRARLDVPLRAMFAGYLRSEVWTLRRSGDRVLTIEPDEAVLSVMSLNMMDGRRVDEVEDRAHAVALRRLATLGDRLPS